ncbi:MAG: amidohydrolase family protein [Anaerolineae bacterium]
MWLTNVRLFDGTGRVWPSAAVCIQEERIQGVYERTPEAISPEETVLDLAGKTVIPGLINCHTHLCLDAGPDPTGIWMRQTITKNVLVAAQHAERTLRAGITTVRDLGGMEYVDIALRDAINEGLIAGPRMRVSGKVICMTGGHGWGPGGREADGPDEVRKAAREQLKAGADIIKIMATGGVMTLGVEPGSQQLTEEEMRAAVEEARKAGKLTASHAQGTAGIKAVVRAGIDSIEHGFYLDDEAIELMLAHGTYYVPTLAALHHILEAGTAAGIPAFMVEKSLRARDAQLDSFERARRAGVPIAAGNDGGTPFNPAGNLPSELERLVENGMTPAEALMSATKVAAQLLRMEAEIGTIEAGKRADLVVLEADPLEDIRGVHQVWMVIKDGRIVHGRTA